METNARTDGFVRADEKSRCARAFLSIRRRIGLERRSERSIFAKLITAGTIRESDDNKENHAILRRNAFNEHGSISAVYFEPRYILSFAFFDLSASSVHVSTTYTYVCVCIVTISVTISCKKEHTSFLHVAEEIIQKFFSFWILVDLIELKQ